MTYHYNLNSLFRYISESNSHHIAIKFQDESYSYAQLNQDVSQCAFTLFSEGVKKGDVIAIINSKEYASYVLMLACLKLGVVYANIDPESPSERFSHILETCKPVRIIADHQCSQSLIDASTANGKVIEQNNLFQSTVQVCEKTLAFISQSVDGDSIAYIMFTSGSTGKPKGVAISHQNLLHFIGWSVSYFNVSANDTVANVNPMYFDNSVFDFYTALFSGASLAPVKKHLLSSAKLLVNFVDEMQCTIWFSVPSLLIYLVTMRVLTSASFSYLRVMVFGGEGYPKVELKKLFDLYSSRIQFVNVYGPTECTCICSHYEVTAKDFIDLNGLPPLGYINENFSFLIQNADGELEAEGELCLLGPNVGRGYFNNSEVTSKAFVEQTGQGYYRNKMYRTGDIVTIKDGLLYFVGRKDNQIKHMGYRIELEEIELAIGFIHEVTQVAVVYQKSNSLYGKIVAFIASEVPLEQSYIRDEIAHKLPSYMMPSTIVLMKDLPKNPNGKIDKTSLQLVAKTAGVVA